MGFRKFPVNANGIDFGSDSVKIYNQKKDRLIMEKNMISVRDDGQVLAVGDKAYEMFGKNPAEIEVLSPVEDGRIADTESAGFILKKLLARLDSNMGRMPLLYFSVMLNLSRIEERAYEEISGELGMGKTRIFLVDQPLCDAVNFDIDIFRTRGSLLVNMGSECSVISVISNGQIVVNNIITAGGRRIDESICEAVRRRNNVLIGIRTADRLKRALGDLSGTEDARKTYGMDTVSGLPRDVVIRASTVNSAVISQVETVAEEINSFLKRVPPQISDTIKKEGIFISGGTSRLKHLEEYMTKYTGTRINISPDYELSTVNGLEKIINRKYLNSLARPLGN